MHVCGISSLRKILVNAKNYEIIICFNCVVSSLFDKAFVFGFSQLLLNDSYPNGPENYLLVATLYSSDNSPSPSSLRAFI